MPLKSQPLPKKVVRKRVVFRDILLSELRDKAIWLVCRAYRVGRLRTDGDKSPACDDESRGNSGLLKETRKLGVDARFTAVKTDAAMEQSGQIIRVSQIPTLSYIHSMALLGSICWWTTSQLSDDL